MEQDMATSSGDAGTGVPGRNGIPFSRRDLLALAALGLASSASRVALAAAPGISRRLLQQDIKFRLGFNIEEQNSISTLRSTASSAAVGWHRWITQRPAYLLARFSYAGKNDAVAADTDAAQRLQLPAGDDIETISAFGQVLQDRQISV